MRKVPEPLYQQVLEIALALTNATDVLTQRFLLRSRR